VRAAPARGPAGRITRVIVERTRFLEKAAGD
jgi:hypothetical protein